MTETGKWNLLAAVASGNITEEQQEMLEGLSNKDKEFEKQLAEAKDLYDAGAGKLRPSFDLNRAHRTIQDHINPVLSIQHIPERRTNKGRLVTWLAAACIIAAVSTWWFVFEKNTPASPLTYITVTAGAGTEKKTISLPDGSLVYLNGKTTVRYASGFTSGKREIFLQGDAFFQITKDPQHPFTVRMGDMSTVVLGTSFRIRTDSSTHNVEVMVATGKVAVKNDTTTLGLLIPGEGLYYDKATKQTIRRKYDEAEITGINEQTLSFRNSTFTHVASELEKWYGVKIFFLQSGVRDYQFSGEFHNSSLKNILDAMAITSSVIYSIKADSIYINNQHQ